MTLMDAITAEPRQNFLFDPVVMPGSAQCRGAFDARSWCYLSSTLSDRAAACSCLVITQVSWAWKRSTTSPLTCRAA